MRWLKAWPLTAPTARGPIGRGNRSRGLMILLVGTLVVLVGWLLTPHPVPLYDGVGFPDEPYRYVKPPSASMKTAKAPGSATQTLTVVRGANEHEVSTDTRESGPQAALELPSGALATPRGPLVVRVVPQAPTDQPPGAYINGNVYAITAAAPGGPVQVTGIASSGLVELRAPNQGAHQVIVFRPSPGQAWTRVPTSRLGRDIWGTSPRALGDYAVADVNPTGQASGGASGSSGTPLWVWVVAVVVLLLLIAVLVLRRRSPERAAGSGAPAEALSQPTGDS